MKRHTQTNGHGQQSSSSRLRGGDTLHSETDVARAGDGAHEIANPEMRDMIHRQLEILGEDPDREGLQRTPERVARSLAWLTRGYRTCVQDVVGQGVFRSEGHHNMVMVR